MVKCKKAHFPNTEESRIYELLMSLTGSKTHALKIMWYVLNSTYDRETDTYHVPSFTAEGEVDNTIHIVDLEANACSDCLGYQRFGDSCSHLRAMRIRSQMEFRKLQDRAPIDDDEIPF